MSVMLPSTEKSNGKDLDGKMACMSLRGYSNCARQSVDLDEILNSIRENLRLEQKHVMELNFITMHRLMSPLQVCIIHQSAIACSSICCTYCIDWCPLQAALFLVDAHPAYCDALALANILATQLDENKSVNHSGKLHNSESGGSQSNGDSPASSDNKSDTCHLLRTSELEMHESG